MQDASSRTIYLKDYQAPSFWVDGVELTFFLDENDTKVDAKITFVRNPDVDVAADLTLVGSADAKDSGALLAISIDGKELSKEAYVLDDETLTLKDVPDRFVLETSRQLDPDNNKSLDGLYRSSGNFCTQCEAEGFRKITWFIDRPDVMTAYKVKLIGDKEKSPVLLSNGNLVEKGDLADGKHFCVWEDPFKKPSYLFALVAGQLVERHDTFETMTGKKVDLHVWVEEGNLEKTVHCMESLKKSMTWDEEVFGREYDLNIFNLVAVGDFNMGAMENKSLNVFNTKYVLADPETATDTDFAGIEGVVGHEYFHNWSGNRITCRDWFQLSLKEGFTVFRDQEFSADMGSRAVKRIDDVMRLRAAQFPEDKGPTAHPVRPDAYQEINNFYTVTIYEKGAEVVRMYHTLLGAELFRKGSDLYFERHDGQAVTCDDFFNCMQEVSGRDLSQFALWYSQAGTPQVSYETAFDDDKKMFSLTLKQQIPDTPGQSKKKPMLLPVKVGLLDKDGNDLALKVTNGPSDDVSVMLEFTEKEQTFVFENISEAPVPSLFRDFSAPIKVVTPIDDDELILRMAKDSDSFNRFEASQSLSLKVLLSLVENVQKEETLSVSERYLTAFHTALSDDKTDPALVAYALNLPSENLIGDAMEVVDPEAIHLARNFLKTEIAKKSQDVLQRRYESLLDDGPYSFDKESTGRRALKSLCLGLLMSSPKEKGKSSLAAKQFTAASNMTDTMAALVNLTHVEEKEGQEAMAAFYERFKEDALVVDKWLSLNAISSRDGCMKNLTALLDHEAFTLENPNKVRSLIGAFAAANPLHFHKEDGSGYAFLADQVEKLDAFNGQVAARILLPLTRWRRQNEKRQNLMKKQLERLRSRAGVSKDVLEISSKALKEA
ncbi:MAG: aminopeptidase N [Deltaproteobacteria bacterium]|nr:aminopeptidase N [Deltaproteobacteria bacterium]